MYGIWAIETVVHLTIFLTEASWVCLLFIPSVVKQKKKLTYSLSIKQKTAL